ncbi:MAG: phage tail tape measure protein, partial [Pseudonocardiaceae bacterium]
MSILSELLVRIGVDDKGVDKGTAGAESKLSKFSSKMGTVLKTAGVAAGAIGGAAIASGIANTLNVETAQKKLQAQLGGTGPMAAEMGGIAGKLYANAYGENLGEVNDAVLQVVHSGALMEDATNEQIQSITAQAMSMKQVFGVDVADSMRAVGQMMRTGMAPDAQAAMDILVRGFQNGNDKAGDLLDTFNEYSTQFRKLGLDGQTAMGLISQGLQAGARDSDLVADAIKEFSIRAVDGSKTTAEGFQAIGLNADQMTAKIAQGGPVASAALGETLNALRAVKDPAERAQVAVKLFGTQAEDLGAALFALDPSRAVGAMGQVAGAAQKMDATIGDTAQNKITSMQRSWDQWTTSLVAANGPLGSAAAGVMAFGQSGLSMAGNMAMVGVAMGPFSGKILGLAGDVAMSTGR